MSTANGNQSSMESRRANATSRSLIARVRANDGDAWNRLVELYAPFVFQYCQQARLPAEDASDVLQEVFQAAWSKIASFEKERPGDTFRGWLRTITRHKIVDHFRRQKRQPRAVGGTEIQMRMSQVSEPSRDDDPGEPPSTESTLADDLAEVRLFRGALDAVRHRFQERTWKAFLGTVVDGRPPADVGEELDMSPGAVRVAKSRVLQRLRSELGDLLL